MICNFKIISVNSTENDTFIEKRKVSAFLNANNLWNSEVSINTLGICFSPVSPIFSDIRDGYVEIEIHKNKITINNSRTEESHSFMINAHGQLLDLAGELIGEDIKFANNKNTSKRKE